MFRLTSPVGMLLCARACFAAIGAVSVQPTSSQAVLSFTVSDPTQCLVVVYSDVARTQPVDDTNATLFAGSQRCNRAESAIDGSKVSFVAGLRTAQKASDGKFHSRALAAMTAYYYTITDVLNFQTAQGSFTTLNPPLGNMYPEQPPFDPAAWDNRAYPQFTWTPAQKSQMLVDPTTGLLVKRMTIAGDAYAKGQNSVDGSGSPLATAITGSSTCTNTANLNSSGTSFANCTGAAKLFMPLPAFQMIGSGVFNNWYPRFNVDDLLLYLYGSADATATGAANGSNTVSVCLAQGLNLPCLSQQFNVTLQSSTSATGTVKVPAATPSPVFADWGYTPLHGDVVPTPGTVAVSGNTVSLTNPGQPYTYQNAFDVDWPPGSQIYIQGSSAWGCVNNYCTIQSIQSAVQLTAVETCSSACPTSANYEGRAFGFQVARQGSSGSINVSFGFEADMSTSWSVLEDGITQHCNQNPVTVSNDASGNPYSGYTLQGYVCMFQNEWAGTAYWLLISKDQFGAPLGEMRPLGQANLQYTTSWTSNGASLPNGGTVSFAGWHPTDGSKFLAGVTYNNGSTLLLVSAQYDSTKPGCNPPYMNWSGAQHYIGGYGFPAEACLTYTNLTNPSSTPPMDLRSQIVRAYATFNPGFDLSGFTVNQMFVTGGYARTCLGAITTTDRTLSVCGTFDANTGNLVQVFDSFSKYPGRWGYVHGPIHPIGNYHSLTLDQPYPTSANTGNTLYGPFEVAVTAVNRAGFGQTPNWTAAGGTPGTSMAANEGYACPTGVPSNMVAAGATGNHCIEVQLSSEPCSHTPGTAALYPSGRTEAQQFPCTSADGSVVTNAAWSKLQNVEVGDWMRENVTFNDYGEEFIVAVKNVISPTAIQLWLIRGSGVWPNNAQPPYATLSATHPDGMSLAMTSNWINGAANWLMDATDPTATWMPDNPAWVLVHGASVVGSNPDNKIAVGIDLQNQAYFAGFFDTPISQQVMQPLIDLSAVLPVWAGSTAGYNGVIQVYMNGDQTVAPARERRWFVNYRHLNPSSGTGAEYRSSPGGPDTLTPVAGTNQVYLITDPYSGGPADPKNLPFILFAGRFLLKDISSPNTATNTITDATNFSACYAINAGECRTNSAAGNRYVSVPFAAGENQCLTNQYEEVAPCFFNASPIAGKIEQMDISGPLDKYGLRQRMLSTAFAGIGGQYQFSEPKMSPDGAWMFVPCWWLNGVRSEVCGVYLPPFPVTDSVNRTTFEPYDVKVSGLSGDQVRLCWGYAENGPVDGSANSLFPTTRQERGCSLGSVTTPPTAGPPFGWASEPANYASCSSGCTIRMNLIPDRVAYYVIQRNRGGTITTSPVMVVAQH